MQMGDWRRGTVNRQKSPQKRFLSILGLFMFGFYFVLGLVIILWEDFPLDLDRTYRMLFGLLLIVYSVIRFIRLFSDQRALRRER